MKKSGGGQEFSFGKVELHISGDHPNVDIRRTTGNTRVASGKEVWARDRKRVLAMVGT